MRLALHEDFGHANSSTLGPNARVPVKTMRQKRKSAVAQSAGAAPLKNHSPRRGESHEQSNWISISGAAIVGLGIH
jgi:hypothetical protein